MIIQIIQHKDICAKSQHNAILLSNNNPLPLRTYQQDKHNLPLFFHDLQYAWPYNIVSQIEFDAEILKTLRHCVTADQNAGFFHDFVFHLVASESGVVRTFFSPACWIWCSYKRPSEILGRTRANKGKLAAAKNLQCYTLIFECKSAPDIFFLFF